MPHRAPSYLSYNWPDKPLGSLELPGCLKLSDENKMGVPNY